VRFIGDVRGVIDATLKLPTGIGEFRAFAQRDGAVSPSPNLLRVSPFSNVLEKEPNPDASSVKEAVQPPIALNGVIAAPGDADCFKIKAKKDQSFDVNVYARRLRSPLDSVLAIYDAAGKALASNDDTNGPDSYIRFAAPADGEYTIAIHDQLLAGGADYVYRIEVVPVQPQLGLAIPLVAANSQERQTVVVPRGNRYATLIRATRADFSGDVSLHVDGLPKGVAIHADPVAAGP
jgi:hypothetical protein